MQCIDRQPEHARGNSGLDPKNGEGSEGTREPSNPESALDVADPFSIKLDAGSYLEILRIAD